MTRISLSEVAHRIVSERLPAGGLAIDATLGNGHDTLFLAQCVGDSGHVDGFDVQMQAVQASRQRLLQHGLLDRVTLVHASHSDMSAHIEPNRHGRIRAIMFNLGYLPGGDKTIITQPDSTLIALHAACLLLAVSGVITVLAYPGHAGGDAETRRLAAWCEQLDPRQFQWEVVLSHHPQPRAPQLFVIRKTSDLL